MKQKCLFFIVVTFLLGGCVKTFEPIKVTGLPIKTSKEELQSINIDVAISSAHEAVKQWLPEASYRSLVYFGKCDDLTQLKGRIAIQFLQIEDALFGFQPQVLDAITTIDTMGQTLDIHITDETNHYPSTNLYPQSTDENLHKIAGIAYEEILKNGIKDCEVTLTQLGDTWNILCDPLNAKERKCAFSIDSESLQVIDYVSPK